MEDTSTEDVDAKLWTLSWDADLCERSAAHPRHYRLLPPSEHDGEIAALLGITITYAPLLDGIIVWSSAFLE